jgi:citronellol/citronellal dehydrogenase
MSETERSLSGKTLLISGGSRGIGLEIALRAARDGASVALIAKTDEPHPKLEGTVHTAARAIEAAGGRALPIVGDVRDADSIDAAVARVVDVFGGIDVVVNNASAIAPLPSSRLSPKQYDLMQSVNARGTFLLTRASLPALRRSANPHVLTLSPPLNLDRRWLEAHAAYTLSKYGMTMLTIGFAEELRAEGIAANTLWPRTLIATAAVRNILGGEQAMARTRTPAIVADCFHAIVTRPARECTGNTFLDEEVLAQEGITDLEGYRASPGTDDLLVDLFLDG